DFTFQQADARLAGPYFSHSIDKTLSTNMQNSTFPFKIVNNGNMPLDLKFNISASFNTSDSVNMTAWLSVNGDTNATQSPYFNTTLEIGQTLNLTLNMMFSPVQNATEVTINISENGYDWESSSLYTDSRTPHGMRVTVNFS
ncbi:MAG: hypothetical protein Q7J68_02605, partial [Thermoplasmata archaeon]|nr:hypothetical protein [Thermoplasmata archaeon]